MITLYFRDQQSIRAVEIGAQDTLPPGVLWIDIFNPTLEEERSIETQLNIQIPTKEEVWKNEVLNRLYNDDGVSYMTAAIINKVDSPHPQTSAITFIMAEKWLVTMRYISPTSFQNYAQRIVRHPQKFTNGAEVLDGLLEEVITRVAHNSEIVVQELDSLSHEIFGKQRLDSRAENPSQTMKTVLRRLGMCADLNSKINESLHSLHRLVNFFRESLPNDKRIKQYARTLNTDIAALSKQTDFLADKITFQLDATLGMINVEQNQIMKIFSVVSVFLLPPTLIGTFYGMNFEFIPGLHSAHGYLYAVIAMLWCSALPYIYFRRRGWL